MAEKIKQWLKPEEWERYKTFKHHLKSGGIMTPCLQAYEVLAECRRLMERAKDYIEDDGSGMPLDATGHGICVEIAQAIDTGRK